jgi:hypothetical protein
MVVDPGIVEVASATGPVKETDDEAGIIAELSQISSRSSGEV